MNQATPKPPSCSAFRAVGLKWSQRDSCCKIVIALKPSKNGLPGCQM